MKTINNLKLKLIALFAVCLLIPSMGYAQDKIYYANGDWQFNVPIHNGFANKASGWGMNFEGGYYVTPNIGVGLFLAYSTNHKYIPTETFTTGSSALTTNQQHSLFQLPFGVGVRYRVANEGMFEPYIGLKLGANYAQMSSYFSAYKVYDRNWGFYMSPEVGTNIWFTPNKTVGLNVAMYYSFATNKGTVMASDINNLNNFGFRVGLAF